MKEKSCLFSGFKRRISNAPVFKSGLNINAALATIEFCAASPLNTGRRFRAIGSGCINFSRVDIIANAMDHAHDMIQLRMNVNNFATHSQKQVSLLAVTLKSAHFPGLRSG
jgi:hypothetical protein